MKERIIEIVALGQPQSLIQRQNAPITELIKTDLLIEELNEQLRQPHVGGSLLKSLHQDLKGFQEMEFLTPDAKSGLGVAIEQVERYMRGDLEARQQ